MRNISLRATLICVGGSGLNFFGSAGLFAQETNAAPQEQAAPSASSFDHDHTAWDHLLKKYVDAEGMVNYRDWRRKDRTALRQYLNHLQAVKPLVFHSWTSLQKQAFWINAYNAYTIELILRNDPVESIKDLGSLLRSVFSKRFIPLQRLSSEHTKLLSLGEVEHEILGRRFTSPLFHFAIVCASKSCPRLRMEAYRASILISQLEDQARLFLRDPQKNDQRVLKNRLRISKIFDWSEDELERFPGGIHGLLQAYGPEAVRTYPDFRTVRLKYRSYDWRLNEQVPQGGSK